MLFINSFNKKGACRLKESTPIDEPNQKNESQKRITITRCCKGKGRGFGEGAVKKIGNANKYVLI